MKCPTCQTGYMAKHFDEQSFIWLCPRCGSATWGDGCAVFVPAQAKSHAALREALEEIVSRRDAVVSEGRGTRSGSDGRYDRARAALALDAAPK